MHTKLSAALNHSFMMINSHQHVLVPVSSEFKVAFSDMALLFGKNFHAKCVEFIQDYNSKKVSNLSNHELFKLYIHDYVNSCVCQANWQTPVILAWFYKLLVAPPENLQKSYWFGLPTKWNGLYGGYFSEEEAEAFLKQTLSEEDYQAYLAVFNEQVNTWKQCGQIPS